jgi:hypothetical protein
MEDARNAIAADDFLFFETWELRGSSHLGAMFRAKQIQRANPSLAAEIRAELKARISRV